MRNIFDQFDQPENKLTHALFCTLCHDRKLIRPFLQKCLRIDNVPSLAELKVTQQSIPGVATESSKDEASGLPDMCIYSDEGWGVFFEMKVQATLTSRQLDRHIATAKRYGFKNPILVAISVEQAKESTSKKATCVQWRDLYAWFAQRESDSFWARQLVQYMECFEEKAINNDYEVRGTITMFNGLRFDDKQPFHYLEAKRLIRLLGNELQNRSDLQKEMGVDPQGNRRSAITNDRGLSVWDYLPLRVARGETFTKHPHLTLSLRPEKAIAAVTIPNGISGGFKSRLKELGIEGFLDLIATIEKQTRPLLEKSAGSRPILHLVGRHFKSQRSTGIVDAEMQIDLRTCVASGNPRIKYQPQWAESIYTVWSNKKSNIQCGIEMQFSYDCPVVRSPDALDLFADAWKATRPFIDFALGRKR